MGTLKLELDTRDDLYTVNEVFCRRDYRADNDLQVAVDVGANIGIATLYFLSRNATSRVYAVEPDPKNISRFTRNTAGYGERVELMPVAAGEKDGQAPFYLEVTGRYGGFEQGWKTEQTIVPVRSFHGLLDDILLREGRIDVLKVDTEGSEIELVGGLQRHQLERIDRIYYETDAAAPFHASLFDHSFATQTNALIRRRV